MSFEVPDSKMVPHLYPEAPEFQQMSRVLATGFMVGLVEFLEITQFQMEASILIMMAMVLFTGIKIK